MASRRAGVRSLRVVMLLPNNPYPQDPRVRREAQTLTAAGHHVTVVCPRESGQARRETVDGVHVRRHRLPIEGRGVVLYVVEYTIVTVAALFACLGLLVRGRLDVVHVHNPPDTLGFVAGVMKIFGKSFVYDHHDVAPELLDVRFGEGAHPVARRILLLLERMCCRLADRVIATNESYRQLEMKRDGVSQERIVIVRNGPLLEQFQSAAPDDSLRAGAEILLCYAGLMGPQDGVDNLVRVMGHLVHDLDRRGVRCLMVGRGPAMAGAQALSVDLNLTPYVEFTGWLSGDSYLSHIATADICVEPAPSNPYNELSTTIKIMEYMALGKPIVAFDLAEHRISADGAAVYVPPNDELAMARAIADLSDDPAKRAEMGIVALKRVEEELAWSHCAPQLLEVYEALAGRQ